MTKKKKNKISIYLFLDKSTKTKHKAEKNKWLNEFIQRGSISATCKVRKISRQTFYDWIKQDPEFKRIFEEEARPMITTLLEDEAYRRAMHGVPKGIYYKGKKIATEKEYSDGLLNTLLRANCPERYKNVVDTTVNGNMNINEISLPEKLAERMRKADENKDSTNDR